MFHSIFADKKGVITSNLLKQFFQSRANPFLDGLKLYVNCQTGNTVKSNTLAYVGKCVFFSGQLVSNMFENMSAHNFVVA